MSIFEFVLVLVSIIVGLAMTEIFVGLARMLRREIDAYWLHSIWAALLLLFQVQAWWGLWELHKRPTWTFGDVLLLLPPPMFLFLASSVLFPRNLVQADMRVHYTNTRLPFFLVLCAIPIWYTILEASTFAPQLTPEPFEQAIRILAALALVVLAFVGRLWVQASLTLAMLAGNVLFFIFFMWRLAG
jgi:hypothetical protein